MPIRPENRDRYPADWPVISECVRFGRAKGRCECRGECGRPRHHLDTDGHCRNRHGQPAYRTGSRVVLTTAHLNHTPEDTDPDNLRAMCQGCHVHHDAEHHAHTRRQTKAAELARTMHPLFDITTATEEEPPDDDHRPVPRERTARGLRRCRDLAAG